MPMTDLKMIGETDGFERYISLYEKSLKVTFMAELFYFL